MYETAARNVFFVRRISLEGRDRNDFPHNLSFTLIIQKQQVDSPPKDHLFHALVFLFVWISYSTYCRFDENYIRQNAHEKSQYRS